ncbi:MAG: SCO family protein [Balneolaceae bacterium]|nr:SCO family protein [Balneolaceae bacterium]
MKLFQTLSTGLLILLVAQSAIAQHMNHNAMKAQPVQSEHSVYHMDASWTDHRGESFQLADLQGNPVVVVMFYGNCTQVCPILIRDARRVFEAVDESLRSEVNILAVTFDPENDTPEVLRNYAIKQDLNIPQWHFTTAKPADIRELAMLLGVQYAQKSDGHFSHSNLVTVLDERAELLTGWRD